MEKTLTIILLLAIGVVVSESTALTLPLKVTKFDKTRAAAISGSELSTRNLILSLNSRNTDTEDCPTWMHRTNGSSKCICGVDCYHRVKCDQSDNRVYILNGYRMTYDKESREEILGASPYGINSLNLENNSDVYLYHVVPMNKSLLDKAMCSEYNRKGPLCGECKEGYSPLVYSYNLSCVKCSPHESKHNIIKFICVALVPLTAFYIMVVIFQFNANSPSLHGFILYAQLISTPSLVRLMLIYTKHTVRASGATKALATLYGIWNLDFFRTLYPNKIMCLQVTTLQALALDYVIAFYPLLLILFTLAIFKLHSRGCRFVLLLCYPVDKCLQILKGSEPTKKTSIIDVFATFLLLSYGRIMSVSFNLLFFTHAINSRGKLLGRYLYYDATYKYLGREHLPYGALALFLFTIFNILPLLLLFLYPMKWFHKCLNHLRLSSNVLHTFVDSFAGCYKDGTEPGIRDCRYFAALSLLTRILFYISYDIIKMKYFYGVSGIIATILMLLHALLQPYKEQYKVYNKVTTAMIALMVVTIFSALNICIAHSELYRAITISLVVFGIVVLLPLVYISVIVARWLVLHSLRRLRFLLPHSNRTEDISEESLLIEEEARLESYSTMMPDMPDQSLSMS